jgi:predicted DNA-binding ribbon-helix-helix protein
LADGFRRSRARHADRTEYEITDAHHFAQARKELRGSARKLWPLAHYSIHEYRLEFAVSIVERPTGAVIETRTGFQGRIIAALGKFGLHRLLVTPNKEPRLLRQHTRSAILIHRKEQQATMTSLRWEELETLARKRDCEAEPYRLCVGWKRVVSSRSACLVSRLSNLRIHRAVNFQTVMRVSCIRHVTGNRQSRADRRFRSGADLT